MSFDNSRYLFNPFNDYSGVVMPQGRVQLDADWNELLAEITRRIQAGTLDIMGRAVYPETTPDAFYISASGTPWVVNIGQGRMYVDGLLAENHGPIKSAGWDPALAELSGSPQPAPASISNTPSIAFTSQPMFPAAAKQDLPSAAGSYLFYLDVWVREVTWLEDPFTANASLGPGIVDPAVGVDTSGRLQMVWQVRWMPAALAGGSGPAVTCGTPDAQIVYPAASSGLLTNGVTTNTTTGDCCLTSSTGYTGLENQFYRVQVHKGGPIGTATFKWSRENASVATSVTNIVLGSNPSGAQATVLTVASLGRDQVLNFAAGDWIELLDDSVELDGQPDPSYPHGSAYTYGNPGILCQIDSVDPTSNSIYLVTPPLTNAPTASASLHTRIVRWDYSSTLTQAENQIPGGSASLQLENGLTVSFKTSVANGNFLSGDFWTFSARTDGSYDVLTSAPPRGTHHHYTKLSVVTFDASGTVTHNPDCRLPWASSDEGDCGCCTATVGDNQNSFGKFTSITQAIASLPKGGGTVCLLPGQYYEYVVLDGLTQVKLQGSGPQTTLYAPPAPSGTADQSGSTKQVTTESGINAIITIANCEHIELCDFAIEAPKDMACILLDEITTDTSSQELSPYDPTQANWFGGSSHLNLPAFTPSDNDVKLTDLVLSASTRPAIVAVKATLLHIVENRILLQDVSGLYPALYVSGAEITVERNWIGLQDNANAIYHATYQLTTDNKANFTAATTLPVGNGGIQVGGYSTNVTILNNDIIGGAFNGITLGAILRMGSNNVTVSGLNGLFLSSPVTSTGTTLVLPPASGSDTLAADGPITNIRIERNRILNTGLCAIGPVGFFTSTTPEMVSLTNISILGNTISSSLQAPITPLAVAEDSLGYAAICLLDTQNLILQDNTITDFGSTPGAQVCGIYLLNVEQADISRNRLEETRDWTFTGTPAANTLGVQAGIAVGIVSPPAASSSNGATPLYQPGLPALRMDQNVVRVPVGYAFAALGYGPFSITGNQFTSGGAIKASPSTFMTVCVINLGAAVELDITTTFTSLWGTASTPSSPSPQVVDSALSNSTNGTVLFANNLCQLEPRTSGVTGVVSVAIMTMDHLNFSNNLTWMDGTGTEVAQGSTPTFTALMDVLLLGSTVNVSGNRFQEAQDSVLFSGITAGNINITTGNISTFCLFTEPNSAPFGVNANNISVLAALASKVPTGGICNAMAKDLLGGFGLQTEASSTTPGVDTIPVQYKMYDAQANVGSLEKVGDTAKHADEITTARVQQLSVVHQARLTQVTRISNAITEKLGVDSTQAIAAKAAVTSYQVNVSRVEMIKQQVSQQPPAVTATGWALYGFVYNATSTGNTPASSYTLYFVDSTNTYQSTFGIAYTGTDGSFHIVYPGPAAGQTAPTTPLFVQICNPSGDPVYKSGTAFTPNVGAATYQTFTLAADIKPLGVLPLVFRGTTLPVLDVAKEVGVVDAAAETEKKTNS